MLKRILLAFALVLALHSMSYAQTACAGGGCGSGGFTGGTVSDPTVFDDRVTFGTATGAANAIEANLNTGCFTFEGATADAVETRLCATDPLTGDTIINLPTLNGTDTVAVLGTAQAFTARQTFGSAVDAANTVDLNLTAGTIAFEGVSADAVELFLAVADPTTADKTWTIPNLTGASHTFQDLETAQTVSGTKTYNAVGGITLSAGAGTIIAGNQSPIQFGTGGLARIVWQTALTPDGMIFTVTGGAASNSAHVTEEADQTFDFNNGPAGTATATNPQWIVHDKDQNTTDYQALGVGGISGRFSKTLTESTPTSVVIIPVAAATSVSGQMLYTVHARDGTNSQTRSGRIIYSGVAEGTTATCVVGTAEELDNTPTGTLTAAITCTSPANNQIQLLIDAASSLTQTTLEAYVTVIHVGAGEILPQ